MTTSITASDFYKRKFNYLIVGGGTAGLVVPNTTVGVLEAGPASFDDPLINVADSEKAWV